MQVKVDLLRLELPGVSFAEGPLKSSVHGMVVAVSALVLLNESLCLIQSQTLKEKNVIQTR